MITFLKRTLLPVVLLPLLLSCTSPSGDANRTTAASPQDTAAEHSFTTLTGQTIELADYKGQIVLVNFWATWCGPCRIEMPDLDHYYRTHRDKGFVLLAVNAGESAERVEEFIAQHDFEFTIVLDESGQIADHFGGIRAMPTSFLLDREGNIQQQFFGAITPAMLQQSVTPLFEETDLE